MSTREIMHARAISSCELFASLNLALAQVENNEDDRTVVFRNAVARLLNARQVTQREFLDYLREEQEHIVKIRPPTKLRASHDAYPQLIGQYREATATYDELTEAGQAGSMQGIVDEMYDIWQSRQAYSLDIANRLRERYGESL